VAADDPPSETSGEDQTVREGEFLSTVAHELKTPVAVITGLADTLSERRHSLTEEQIDHCLNRISRQGDRLARLVGDLVDLSQVESGRLRVRLEPVNVAAVVERALDDAQPPREKSVELNVPEALWAVADARRLEQVLVNLLTNAYSHGGSKIRLDARGERRPAGTATRFEGVVVVTVADDGDGVPTELIQTVFERFGRGPGADGEGSGLGLAIAQTLVDGFGGRIWYERGEPTGAQFKFFLMRAVQPV
jgi:signal transduction histidine kinase